MAFNSTNKILLFLFMMAFGLVVGCTPEFLSEQDLNTYLNDTGNGLSITNESKGVIAKVTYRPTDLLILQENGNSTQITHQKYKKLNAKYGQYYYFILSLSKNNKEALYAAGRNQFGDMVQTLSFRMNQYANITTSKKDTLEVADYIFSRTYGMSDASTLMFVFNKEKVQADEEWIQFNLKEFGMGLGSQVFRFKNKTIKEVPNLKFELINVE